MTPADIIGAMALINGLIINGKKLAVTLGGEELTNEEIIEKIEIAKLQVALNRDND